MLTLSHCTLIFGEVGNVHLEVRDCSAGSDLREEVLWRDQVQMM